MGNHLVFLVHGVGDTKPNWADPVKAQLLESYNTYPKLAALRPFDAHFQFEEINYNDRFDDVRKRWASEATKVLGAFGDGGLIPSAAQELLQATQKLGDDKFLQTHALDVVMYRFFAEVAEAVRSAVNDQIMDHLVGTPFGTDLRWSIIGHSLGTAVVHDTLHAMFRPGPGSADSDLFQPYAVIMIANVSRLLENKGRFDDEGDVFRSFVRPTGSPATGGCRFYVNVRNEFDPIPAPSRFNPADDWPDPQSRKDQRYRNIAFSSIEKDAKVHDLVNYLHNPTVHIPIFRLLAGEPRLIPEDQATAAIKKYNDEHSLSRIKDEELKRLKDSILADNSRDWVAIIKMLIDALPRYS